MGGLPSTNEPLPAPPELGGRSRSTITVLGSAEQGSWVGTMTWGEAAVVGSSLGGMVWCGWVFLNRTLYRDFEEKDQVVQVCAGAVHCLPTLSYFIFLLFQSLAIENLFLL